MKRKIIILGMGICIFLAGCNNSNVEQSKSDSVKEIEGTNSLSEENTEQEDKTVLIQNQLEMAENYYIEYDFDNIGKCYDELDNLGYDTSELRKVYEYDKEVYEESFAFYNTLVNVKESIDTQNYSSVVTLVNELRSVSENFDILSVNSESKIGKYIGDMQSNPMYFTLKANVLELDDSTFTEGIVANGFAHVMQIQLEKMLEVENPFVKTEKDEQQEEEASAELDEIISLIREQAIDVSEKTTTVHVNPTFGSQYYAFETIDTFKESTSETGKKCDVQIRCFQRLEEKNSMLDFAIYYYDDLNFDILKMIISNDVDVVEIGQQDIISQMNSYYIPELSTEKVPIDELEEKALKLFGMGSGANDVYIKLVGAESEDVIRLSNEQKESLLYVSGVWLSILEEYK